MVGESPALDIIGRASVVALIDVMHHIGRADQRPMLEAVLAASAPDARIIVKDLDP